MITDPQIIQKIKNSGAMVITVDLEDFKKKIKGFLPSGENNSPPENVFVAQEKISQLRSDPPPQIGVPTKIEIKISEGKGMGVFATQKILKGEIIETCYLLRIPKEGDLLTDYRFLYPKRTLSEYVIPLGYGCIYNHSNSPNADWIDHPEYKAFNFFALKDIEIGEEICVYYGGEDYWNSRKKINII